MASNLFLPESQEGSSTAAEVDPRRAQLDLVGFLGEEEAASFASELWEMMIDGSQRPSGIPLILVKKKKEEMARAREEERRGRGRGENGGYKRGVAGGLSGEMNSFVREAARRAEMARAALGSNKDGTKGEEIVSYTVDRSGERYGGEKRHDDGNASRDASYKIDRFGDIDNQSKREEARDGLDEFGRSRGREINNNDNCPSKNNRHYESRKRSPSPSRSRSPSYSSESSEERSHERRRRRNRSRSRSRSSSVDMRRHKKR